LGFVRAERSFGSGAALRARQRRFMKKLGMQRSHGGPLDATEADCRVRPEDLAELPKIHALLKALNDPYANIAGLVSAVRVLAARCVRRARLKMLKREVASMEHALQVIGNKGTEEELLGVLEDLTVLKSEIET
jgi:hypothetical protein